MGSQATSCCIRLIHYSTLFVHRYAVDVSAAMLAIARRLHGTPEALFPGFVLGDAGELRELLSSAGLHEVSVIQQSLTVRRPWDGAIVAQDLKAAAAVLPTHAAMTPEQLEALAQATERETGPELRRFVEGAELVYPMSAHIAEGWE
jgi:hypothetical protein